MATYDSYTKSLLHFDGTDGSTTILDEIGKRWYVGGDAQIDTAQYKFSSIGSSLKLDGTGDYIYSADSRDWTPSGDFTIEFFVRFAALPASGSYMTLYQQYEDVDNRVRLSFYNEADTYSWRFYVEDDNVIIYNHVYPISPTMASDTWYHVAIVHSGSDFYCFQDGTQVNVTKVSASAYPNIAAAVEIGRYATGAYYFNGWLAEYRISSYARWTTTFTPPTEPYAPTYESTEDTFSISRNVSNTEDIDITLPSTFSELQDGENVMKINQSYDLSFTPSFTMNSSMDIDMELDIEAVETNYYTGPFSLPEISTTANDCYIIEASRDGNSSFSTTDTKLGMGCHHVQMIGLPYRPPNTTTSDPTDRYPVNDTGHSNLGDGIIDEDNYYVYYNYKSWIPFVVSLAQGTTILSATLEVYAVTPSSSGCPNGQRVCCEKSSDAVVPTTFDELNSKIYTQSYTSDSSTAWVTGTKYTYDITTSVQEVISLANWVSGNTLAVMTYGSCGSGASRREFASFENTSYSEPKLLIVYE